jgi:outer membrane protein assembly factor BamB
VIDLCHQYKCQTNAHCELNQADQPECQCDPGFLLNADNQCVSDVEVGEVRLKLQVGTKTNPISGIGLRLDGSLVLVGKQQLQSLTKTGQIEWTLVWPNSGYGQAPVIDKEGKIFLATSSCHLLKIDRSGNIVWTYDHNTLEDCFLDTPLITSTGELFSSDGSHLLTKISPQGYFQSMTGLEEGIILSAAVDQMDRLYFYGTQGFVYDTNLNIQNQFSIGSAGILPYNQNSLIALSGTSMLFFDQIGTLVCYQLDDNNERFKHEFETGIAGNDFMNTLLIGENNQVYLISMNIDQSYDEKIFAFDDQGQLLFEFRFELPLQYCWIPGVLGKENKLFQACGNSLYALDATSGALLWTYTLTNQNDRFITPPLLADDGTLYVVTSEGYLYGIKTNSHLADSAWPRFGADNQNSFRVKNFD